MRNANKVLGVIAFVILALALYTGAYLANATKTYRVVQQFEPEFNAPGQMTRIPTYRVGGQAAQFIFKPAQRIHMMLRPSDWTDSY